MIHVANSEGNGCGSGWAGRLDPGGTREPESYGPFPLSVGSLFAGLGGFDLGFQRTGHMRTLWFCEQDPFCQRVLAKHWPGIPCYPDVRALVADTDRAGREAWGSDGLRGEQEPGAGQSARANSAGGGGRLPVQVPYVDVLCGGFPCQDISLAGAGAGIDGSRSGLWREFARLIGELRPRYVVAENVPALTSRGLDRVLADLAACGFDAEWDHLPASAFGAPHRRDRIWIVAYPGGEQLRQQPGRCGGQDGSGSSFAGVDGAAQPVADAYGEGSQGHGGSVAGPRERASAAGGARDVGDSYGLAGEAGSACEGERGPLERLGKVKRAIRSGGGEGNNGQSESGVGGLAYGLSRGLDGHWMTEPSHIPRVAAAVPSRVDRLRALGNSLVPQIAEWIGRRILEYESRP